MPTSYYEIARDFHILDRSLITRTNIVYLYRDHSTIMSLGKRKGVDVKQQRKQQKNKSKKKPSSVSEITI